MSRNIILQYLVWQFFDTPRGILRGWQNCLKFNLNHWSVPLLLQTLVSPWRRYHSSYGRGFSFARYFEAFTFNMTSRVLGAIMRTFLIAFGLLTEIFVFLAGASVFLLWLILPILLFLSLFYGFKILL